MSSKRLGKGINAIINPKTKNNNSPAKSATAPGVNKVKLKANKKHNFINKLSNQCAIY